MGPTFPFTFVVFRLMSQDSFPGKLFIVLHTDLDIEFPPRFLHTLYAFQDLRLLLKFCIARRGIQSVLGPLAHIFLCTTLMPTFFRHPPSFDVFHSCCMACVHPPRYLHSSLQLHQQGNRNSIQYFPFSLDSVFLVTTFTECI
jgi:hypothetical protein